MQEFDTLKLQLPRSSIKASRAEIWVQTQKTDQETGEQTESLQIKSKCLPIGVSNLSTAKGGVDFTLTYSAKVLGQDYLEGITLNNWDRVFDSLDPIIEIDRNQVFDRGKVFTCDTTNNLLLDDIGATPRRVYLALLSARANMNFMPITYTTKKKQGIEFRGVQQEKNRMIVYSKHLDLQKTANKEFLSSINAMKLLEQAEKQIRFEVNHTTLRSIRSRLKVSDNSLKAVLQSKVPVNHNFLKKVMNITDIKQTALFGEWEEFRQQNQGKGRDFLIYKGIQSIIKELEYSEPAIKLMFKNIFENDEVYKHHWYKKKNSIKDMLQNEQAKRYGIEPQESDEISNMVLECLLKAVA